MLRACIGARHKPIVFRTSVNFMAKRKASEDAAPVAKRTKSNATAPIVYAARQNSAWKVGAHVSAAGGVENAVTNAASIGANAFALFVKSQRKWTSPTLTDTTITRFKAAMLEHGYDARHVLPHGSYLINLGNPDAEKRKKSYDCFVDDLQRCAALGLVLYNFHPGSTVGEATTEESIALIAGCINDAHIATEGSGIVTVIENMAGAGNIIGGDFAHLGKIIEQVNDKTRVGVCLDTCHMFAAGYDLRTAVGWNKIVSDFDAQVGLSYLRGMHLNDSKTELNSKRDRHENIGLGHIGAAGFHHILNDPRFQDIPLILETPSGDEKKPGEVWAVEIAGLYSLSGALGMEDELKNVVDRVRVVVERVGGGKAKKGAEKKKKTDKGKRKSKKHEDEDEDEDYAE
ncbi:AP-endonuc-2 domain-containing protein [Mycena chlorophos]|uniref:Apurinic-apyrimidinic endonuclease 1 n=1 Tax=Mycena chlorophos TaxID=658473 RepID=A0A8H6RZW2_MYCCL|nr:AP-endonuc-2 domain-containing protein [Mycena chlorophos]